MQVQQEIKDIEKVRAGDSSAYGAIVERYQDMVFTLCVRMLKSEEDAKEVAQDTFVKAYKSINTYEGRSKFSTWLYKIAYNQCISMIRKKTRMIDLIDDIGGEFIDDGFDDGFELLSAEDRRRNVQEAIDNLGETDAVVITLFYLEELSLDEICEVTGMQNNNVRTRLHRARKRLLILLSGKLKSEINSIL